MLPLPAVSVPSGGNAVSLALLEVAAFAGHQISSVPSTRGRVYRLSKPVDLARVVANIAEF